MSASHTARSVKRIGTACGPCRLRKARCDGKSPCQHCQFGEREEECIFVNKPPRPQKDQDQQLSMAKDKAIKLLYNAILQGEPLPQMSGPQPMDQASAISIMTSMGLIGHEDDGNYNIPDDDQSSDNHHEDAFETPKTIEKRKRRRVDQIPFTPLLSGSTSHSDDRSQQRERPHHDTTVPLHNFNFASRVTVGPQHVGGTKLSGSQEMQEESNRVASASDLFQRRPSQQQYTGYQYQNGMAGIMPQRRASEQHIYSVHPDLNANAQINVQAPSYAAHTLQNHKGMMDMSEQFDFNATAMTETPQPFENASMGHGYDQAHTMHYLQYDGRPPY